jgi:hypothetical protein
MAASGAPSESSGKVVIDAEIGAEVGLVVERQVLVLSRHLIKIAKAIRWPAATQHVQVRRLEQTARTQERITLPNLCRSVDAWAEGGFRTVPLSTRLFVARVEGLDSRDSATNRVLTRHGPASLRSEVHAIAKQTRRWLAYLLHKAVTRVMSIIGLSLMHRRRRPASRASDRGWTSPTDRAAGCAHRCLCQTLGVAIRRLGGNGWPG